MTTTASTTTELEERRSQRSAISQDTITDVPADLDDIVEVSRVVDAGVPEGGYGWVAVTACAVICFWFVGTTYCWGLIQGALVADGLSSASTLSWIGSITIACIAILAMVSARIQRSIGSRLTAFCGIGFLAGGELLSSFSVHSVGGLFVSSLYASAVLRPALLTY